MRHQAHPFASGPSFSSGRFAERRARYERRGRDHAAPAVITALCFHVFGNWSHARSVGLIACVLLVIGPIALAWRPKFPLIALAVSAAATIGYATLTTPAWTFAVAPTIALFSAVKAGRSRAALAIAAIAYVAYLTVTTVLADQLGVAATARPTLRDAVLTALGLALTMFIGGAARARAAYLAELTKVNAERARAHEEQEKRQTADERLRIARELHDVLGHHLSLINVQAGVGLHLMDSRPEQAREALTAIKTASSEALREVRAVLDALRPEQEAAPRQPALGLDRLADLTADAALPITTTTTGTPRPLPAEVDRAAYRIVQEALTNVRRHAQAAKTEVSITYTPTALHLHITNAGTPTAPPPGAEVPGPAADELPGTGIAGMRARAETLGGTLTAEPLPEGGFQVHAILPTSPDTPSPAATRTPAAPMPTTPSTAEATADAAFSSANKAADPLEEPA
ncbi:sensor histidine kinase [Winogradskya consettensis]|uniref:histidine kinase n=1 Tax=Winogradskya consettensis TaxID=113560 RepID=A0A919T204_9ACTN|nr:sensor histidine kinase [Actinoplanes consettensis]GIM81391.1 two-component sensor histidine kinase [Actinoplanes consettensis]